VRRSLEDSLERLGLDRVDIVLIHDPDDYMEQAVDEAYPALAELRAQGTIRAVGAGMNSPAPLAWLVERRGVAVLAGGVFNSGILADPGDDATYDYAPAPRGLLARARRMRDACASYGISLPPAALQFTLRHPAVTAVVVGARNAEEITADTSYLSTPIPTPSGPSWKPFYFWRVRSMMITAVYAGVASWVGAGVTNVAFGIGALVMGLRSSRRSQDRGNSASRRSAVRSAAVSIRRNPPSRSTVAMVAATAE
jgi:hypothetical protein